MKRANWSVSEAKAKFSEVVHEAQRHAQVIKNRGIEVAVVIGVDEYREFRSIRSQLAPAGRLKDFLSLSDALRVEGGVDFIVPPRRDRPDSFAGDDY